MPSMAIQSKGVLIIMPSLFTEDTYEQAIIELFENMGYPNFEKRKGLTTNQATRPFWVVAGGGMDVKEKFGKSRFAWGSEYDGYYNAGHLAFF